MRVVGRIDSAALKRAGGKRRSRPSGTDGRIVVVHGAKGGSGTSVLAASLAAALARHAGPVALVDLALASADQDLLWNLDCPLRVDDVLGTEGHELADALVAHAPGVRLLAGPLGPAEAESISGAAIGPLLGELAERHPYVVVDTSSELSEVTVCALEAATRILVPLVPELPALRGTQRLLSMLERLGLDLAVVETCLWVRPGEIDAAAVARVLGRAVDWQVPWAPRVVQESVNAGQPVVIAQPRHPLATGIGQIAANLAGAPPVPVAAGFIDRVRERLAGWRSARTPARAEGTILTETTGNAAPRASVRSVGLIGVAPAGPRITDR